MEDKYTFPVYSALFNSVEQLVFIRDNLSFRVKRLFSDTNHLNLEIRDEKRLKSILFQEIMKRFNTRVSKYNLSYNKISYDVYYKNFNIERFSFSDSLSYSGGVFQIYPRTFYCVNCAHLKMISDNEEWNKFDPSKCPICGERYRQSSVVRYCETCGKVEPLHFYCEEHGLDHWKMIMTEMDQPATWKAQCTKCNSEPIDINPYPCLHEDYGRKISNENPSSYKILTVMENTVYSSETITIVDAPKTKLASSGNTAYILLGLHLNKFDHILDEAGVSPTLDEINELISLLENTPKFIDPKILQHAKDIDKIINEIQNEYDYLEIEKTIEYLIIKGLYDKSHNNQILKYSDYLNTLESNDQKKLINKFDLLKKEYFIQNISYIPDIQLINSAIGVVKGPNKFYEENFVPHFEPFFDYKKQSFKAFSYPFETEGILFELDKLKVVEWLISNNRIDHDDDLNENDANNIIFNLKNNSNAYKAVETLIHTLSHILINRSSLFTGLESDSCGELLFTNNASFLIYSSSNINIGGLLFVFENSLTEWFNDVKLDSKDCVFDPTCLHDTGACFSCLYLPEYVCTLFNENLDRDVLMGKKRYRKGFWEE